MLDTTMTIPTFEDMLAAHERIKPHIHRTPILTSSYFNDLIGAEIFADNRQSIVQVTE